MLHFEPRLKNTNAKTVINIRRIRDCDKRDGRINESKRHQSTDLSEIVLIACDGWFSNTFEKHPRLELMLKKCLFMFFINISTLDLCSL